MERNKVIDEVLEVLWKLELEYFDQMLKGINMNHESIKEEFLYKSDAIAEARFFVEEMKYDEERK